MSNQICMCYPMKLSEACQHKSIEAANINSPLIAIHIPRKE